MNRRSFIKTGIAGALSLLVPIGVVKDVLSSESIAAPIPLRFDNQKTLTYYADDLVFPASDFHSKYIEAAARKLANQVDADIASLYFKK